MLRIPQGLGGYGGVVVLAATKWYPGNAVYSLEGVPLAVSCVPFVQTLSRARLHNFLWWRHVVRWWAIFGVGECQDTIESLC